MSLTGQRDLTPKEVVMQKLQNAMQELTLAHSLAVQANPMAAELPIFQQIQGMAKDLQPLMVAMHKLRGL